MLNAFRPLMLLVACAVAPVVAQDAAAPPPIEIRSQREDAGARIRQVERSGGRVLQAEPMQRGGREVYRFKVLTPEGRVRVVQGDLRDAGVEVRPAARASRFDPTHGPAFDRTEDLTARRREFRNDAGADTSRERGNRDFERSRQPPPAPRAAGDPAGN